MHVRTLRKVRVRRQATIRFTLSKVSDVMLQVRDRRGRVELSRGLRALPYGRHSVAWVPKRAGRHRLRIVAVGPAGTRAVFKRTLRAKPVKRKAAASAAAKRLAFAAALTSITDRARRQVRSRRGATARSRRTTVAGGVEPQQVQREAHADRVHRAAALEEQAVAGGQRVEAGEAAPPRAPVAGDEQRQAAGQRPALERGQARVERHARARWSSAQACQRVGVGGGQPGRGVGGDEQRRAVAALRPVAAGVVVRVVDPGERALRSGVGVDRRELPVAVRAAGIAREGQKRQATG